MLPSSSWKKHLSYIQTMGEGESITSSDIGDDYDFLRDLGVISSINTGELTDEGDEIFCSVFIRRDEREREVLRNLLLRFPPTIALQQYLWGVKDISVSQVLTVLKTTKLWQYATMEPLTHFLDLLNYAGVISYSKKHKLVHILISPDTEKVPTNVFIDPTRPYSNIVWIKRILGECEGYIYWFDKHFQKEALDWLWAVADANRIREIKILSLDMGDSNLSSETKKLYRRLKTELASKGIDLIWATIDSKLVRDSHDRWIIGQNEYVRNVPNVNAISSGQRSEMNLSDNYEETSKAFAEYWLMSTPVSV